MDIFTIQEEAYKRGYEAGVKSVTGNNVGGKMTPTDKDTNVPSKWIPVTDRLPEIPDDWAEHPDPVLYMMKTTKTIYAGYYGENGTYRDRYFRQYHDRYEGVDADDVLCWMWQHDLPEPPKGEPV